MPFTRGIDSDPRRPLVTPALLQEAPVASSSRGRPRRCAGLGAGAALALATGALALGVAAPVSAAESVPATVAVAAETAATSPVRTTDRTLVAHETSSGRKHAHPQDEPLAPAIVALSFAAASTGLVVTAHRRARRR
jgi:hypothetical protein